MGDSAPVNRSGEARRVFRDPVLFLAFGFGSGLLRPGPGTFGTLAAVPLFLAARWGGLEVELVAAGLVVIAGFPICGIAARRLGVHDHPGIVWDEFAGLFVTLLAAPPGWPWLIAGFLLFRVFDILKPWPIRVADRTVGGGAGIMLDDLMAGALAAACLGVARILVW